MDIHRFSSRKRKQVRRACLNCQKAHSGCGEQRPCPRCVKRKEEHKCIDAPRRKRKDLPEDEEEDEEITYNEEPAVTCNKTRKRKLEQAAPQTSAAMATRNAVLVKTERHRHPHADTDSHDEDYEEDDCCSNTAPVSTSAALVVRNTKRPRRASRWPSTSQPAFSNNTLSFPFDLKQEKDEELACGYGNNNHQHQHSNMDNLGVMGQMQQQVLSQKLSFYHMQPSTHQYIQRQPTQQPTYTGLPKEDEKNCTFIFNPTEFDCVPPQRQPNCEPQPQQQPQLYDNNDLSLEWLVPELNLWGTTTTATTTTTISAPSYAWTGMPEQIPSSFLMEEGTLGSGEENPLFFSDYRTFEPLFSF